MPSTAFILVQAIGILRHYTMDELVKTEQVGEWTLETRRDADGLLYTVLVKPEPRKDPADGNAPVQ